MLRQRLITDIESAEKTLNNGKRKILFVSCNPYHGDKNIFQVINLAERLDKDVVFLSINNMYRISSFYKKENKYKKQFEERVKKNFYRCEKLCSKYNIKIYSMVMHNHIDKILEDITKSIKLIDMIILSPEIDIHCIKTKIPVHLYSIHVVQEINVQAQKLNIEQSEENNKEEKGGIEMLLKFKKKKQKENVKVSKNNLNNGLADNSQEKNKILVISKQPSFTHAIVDYALSMASRLNARITALNLDEKAHNFEVFKEQAVEFAAMFQAKAGEKGIKFSHLVAEGDESAVVRKLCAKDKQLKYIINDSPVYLEKGQHFPVYCRPHI
ncbi:hypothetical protein [Desulfovulcanus sp.]